MKKPYWVVSRTRKKQNKYLCSRIKSGTFDIDYHWSTNIYAANKFNTQAQASVFAAIYVDQYKLTSDDPPLVAMEVVK